MLQEKCGVWIKLPTALVNLVETAVKVIFPVFVRFNYFKPCTKTARYLFMLQDCFNYLILITVNLVIKKKIVLIKLSNF